MAGRPRWLAYRSKDGIVASHFEDDEESLALFMLRALEWSDDVEDGDLSAQFRILDTFLSSPTDYQLLEALMSRVVMGSSARVLLAAPDGEFARARAQSLHATSDARLKLGLKNLAEAVHHARRIHLPDLDAFGVDEIFDLIRETTSDLPIEVRFYNDFPGGPVYILRDLALVGRYAAGLSAQRAPWLLVVNDPSCSGDLYDRLGTEFDGVWEAASSAPTLGVVAADEPNAVAPDSVAVVEAICTRFHRGVKTLRLDRDPVDENEVVRILASFLRVNFETVICEEPTPSTAGRSGRVDLMLPDERIGIEVKFARGEHTQKRIFDELLLARERYHKHPNCSVLVCFIYDPGHVVQNRKSICRDLEQREGVATRVIVSP